MSAAEPGEDARRRARAAFEEVLGGIAPEVDLNEIDPDAELRREVDLDSVDFMNVLLGLEEELGIEIPETDAERLTTIDACVRYLAGKL